MTPAPICMTCNLERTLVGVQPVENRHDMLHYECPKCRNVFRLVTQRATLETEDLIFEEPSLRAGTR